ncbi:MAG: polysaccharide biosynthesis protein [Desulfobacteraceae bacterium]|nr:polysaccharide biosynthesis protein [Desulfobacteraceae bacterium]MCB9494323.1 polysaccharide biosynthesis protein [Desulfobacteraceae bacterium]
MKFKLHRNFYIIFLSDLILICISLFGAFKIRYDYGLNFSLVQSFYWLLPLAFVTKIFFFYFFDLYKGMWRYTSTKDLFNILKASTLSSLFFVVIILFTTRFEGLSRSVFFVDWCLTILLISGSRLSIRFFFNYIGEGSSARDFFAYFVSPKNKKKLKKTIIIGAGDCGEKIYREIRDNHSLDYKVIGFLDDSPAKTGRKIHGLPVFGLSSEIKKFVDNAGVEEVIIAIPSANSSEVRRIVDLCKETDARYKIVPSFVELINGNVSIKSIRNVEYRDLLGRKPVKLDAEKIGGYIGGKVVLVTGAGGSIGSGLCSQILKYSPKELILFERAENPLYEIDLELKKAFPGKTIVPVLGDIQEKDDLYKVFSSRRPEIVFHAAAYKQVPMLEVYPWKAVKNNIFGTMNIVDIACEFNCEKFVFVSTDKAVNPANVMGASKRVCEIIVQNKNRKTKSKTVFLTVRFGNVIGSAGSVIPLFKKQIRNGGPVTVTHPEIIRYFMLIPEACQLILQAGAMGNGGEIFVLDMGEPVKIDEMARDLIRFSGFEPDVDIKIEYVGLRPGEKLYEELLTEGEDVMPTDHRKIMVLKSREFEFSGITDNLEELRKYAEMKKDEDIKKMLKVIVPEYVSPFFEHKN